MWRRPANHSMSVYSSAPHDLRWLVRTAFQLQQHPCMWAGGAITHKSYITQRTAESAARMLGITACWRKDSRKRKLMMNNAYYITWKCYKEIQYQWYPQLRCVNKVFGERKKSLKKQKAKLHMSGSPVRLSILVLGLAGLWLSATLLLPERTEALENKCKLEGLFDQWCLL